MAKHIFITGGVVSSLGKGITAASLGRLLKEHGLKVALQKLDPYINIDPGTMSPYQHGEVFVTEDGAETDLDLGHYERFTDEDTGRFSNVTTGKIYSSVIEKERSGEYEGSTVQVIPHITNEIKRKIYLLAEETGVDVLITEIGGTVGDIESLPFMEAIRQIKSDLGKDCCMYIHVTLVPFLAAAGEAKTKPTQHSVKELRSIGIQPDAIVCRAERPLSQDMAAKIALFCDIEKEAVIQAVDSDSIYEVPLVLAEGGLDRIVLQRLNLESQGLDLSEWRALVEKIKNPRGTVKIALVGKYTELHDAYMSVAEALTHAGIANDIKTEIIWIHAAEINEENAAERLREADGLIVPGGFGDRGIKGKLAAIKFAREKELPFFGICLGMQLAVVEFAANVAGFIDAHSTEFAADTPHPVVHQSPASERDAEMKVKMRLGSYPCTLVEGTKAYQAYQEGIINERHRHRYEYNNDYRDRLEAEGLKTSGIYTDKDWVEIVELEGHPWFVGVQFHPEFKSRPNRAHPLIREFVKTAYDLKGE